LLILGLLALAAGGCKRSPTDVYQDLVKAAQEGNVERFTQGFTEESRGVVKGLIELARAYGDTRKDPLTVIGGGTVVREEAGDEQAVLTIQQGARNRKLLFVKTEAGWAIDLRKLDEFWKDKRNLSF
jgi:hypothetical protein